jgi:LPXTG-motif cell wall-anchored protein
VITLPATGASQQANTWMAIIAVGLFATGGALLLARRRTS